MRIGKKNTITCLVVALAVFALAVFAFSTPAMAAWWDTPNQSEVSAPIGVTDSRPEIQPTNFDNGSASIAEVQAPSLLANVADEVSEGPDVMDSQVGGTLVDPEQFESLKQELDEEYEKGLEAITLIAKNEERGTVVNDSAVLRSFITVATERVKLYATWNVQQDVKAYEDTYAEISDHIVGYLTLFSTDGVVHSAIKRMRTSSIQYARMARNGAAKFSGESMQEYANIAGLFEGAVVRLDDLWSDIQGYVDTARNRLEATKSSFGLVRLKVAYASINKAILEIRGLAEDLNSIVDSLEQIKLTADNSSREFERAMVMKSEPEPEAEVVVADTEPESEGEVVAESEDTLGDTVAEVTVSESAEGVTQ